MGSFVQKVSLEEYLELRKNLDLNEVDRIDIDDVLSSGLVKIHYKSPQPMNYKKHVHMVKKYKPKDIFSNEWSYKKNNNKEAFLYGRSESGSVLICL